MVLVKSIGRDGTQTSESEIKTATDVVHTYSEAGLYTIKVSGSGFTQIIVGGNDGDNAKRSLSIRKYNFNFKSLQRYYIFRLCIFRL